MEIAPEVNLLYQKFLESIKPLGKLDIEVKKTSIHIKNRVAFAGIHSRKNYFILNIVSDKPIISQRIKQTEQVSKSRFHNELRIESESDINSELIGWLKTAYELMK